MAIAVGALCSAPVRRLRKAIAHLIPKDDLDDLYTMELIMDSRENHKKYRESLKICPSPAVPYFGMFVIISRRQNRELRGATSLLISCINRLVINKPISGCVLMACDSLLTTSLLQVVNRLVAS